MKLQMNNSPRFVPTKLMIFLARLALAYILLRSAIAHLENPYQFAQSVANYQIFSGFLVSVTAVGISVVEIVVAFAMLFVCNWWNCAAKMACALSGMFLLVQLQALARGLNISCGCFGSGVDDGIGLHSLLQASAVGILGGVCLCSLKHLGLSDEKQRC